MDVEGLTLDLAVKLISIPSVTGEEDKLARFILDVLKGNDVNAFIDDWGNVVAVVGKGKPTFLLNGHMDTVPPAPNWTLDPYKPHIDGDLLYGLGSSDMKGTLAAMIATTIMVNKLYKDDMKGTLVFSAVVGEEGGNVWGSKLLAEKGILKDVGLDYAIVGESSINNGILGVRIGHNGNLNVKVTIKGKSYHSSKPTLGVNAAYRMCELLESIKTLDYTLPIMKLPENVTPPLIKGTIAPTIVKCGQKINVIPGECEVFINRRIAYGENVEDAYKQILEIVNGLDAKDRALYGNPELKCEVELLTSRPPYMLDLNDVRGRRLLETSINALKRIGIDKPQLIYGTGYTDAEIIHRITGAPVVIIGAGETAHTPDEWVKISNLKKVAKAYMEIVKEIMLG